MTSVGTVGNGTITGSDGDLDVTRVMGNVGTECESWKQPEQGQGVDGNHYGDEGVVKSWKDGSQARDRMIS